MIQGPVKEQFFLKRNLFPVSHPTILPFYGALEYGSLHGK